MTPASFQEQLDAYLATIITRETHKGGVNRVRHQASKAITDLFIESLPRPTLPHCSVKGCTNKPGFAGGGNYYCSKHLPLGPFPIRLLKMLGWIR